MSHSSGPGVSHSLSTSKIQLSNTDLTRGYMRPPLRLCQDVSSLPPVANFKTTVPLVRVGAYSRNCLREKNERLAKAALNPNATSTLKYDCVADENGVVHPQNSTSDYESYGLQSDVLLIPVGTELHPNYTVVETRGTKHYSIQPIVPVLLVVMREYLNTLMRNNTVKITVEQAWNNRF
eukprot:gene8622-10211_t